MNDEDTRQQEILRAEEAKQLLSSGLLSEVLNDIEKSTLLAWENTKPMDVDAREAAWSFYIAGKKFRNTLLSMIETGKMATMQVQERKRFSLFNRGS